MAITTTKAVVVQVPSNNADPAKAWLDTTATPFATTAERAEIMPVAKAEARLSAGRVVVRVTKVDDAGSKDETQWTTTVEDKIVVLPSVREVAITDTLSVWARVRQVCMGQPWAESLIAAIDAKLGTD